MRNALERSCFLSALLFSAAIAQAGVVIEQELRDLDEGVVLGRTVYSLEPGKVRIETRNEVNDLITIFNARRRVVWVIDLNETIYYELKPAEVNRIRKQVEEARRRMEEELAKLPAEQRDLIEEMMKQQLPSASGETSVRQTATGETVGSFVCTRYEIVRKGERYGEVWAASLDQLQITPEEFESFRALADFFAPLGSGAPASSALMPAGEGVKGFPVRMLLYEEGRPVREEGVVRVERRDLEDSLFALPPGLEKTEWGQ